MYTVYLLSMLVNPAFKCMLRDQTHRNYFEIPRFKIKISKVTKNISTKFHGNMYTIMFSFGAATKIESCV